MLNLKSILLIEDDPEALSLMKEVLEEEFKVITAYDGQEGLRKFSMQKFDLVISDFKMPKMSGDRLVQHFRDLERKQKLSPNLVLIITGDKELASRKLKTVGHTFILEKPFDNQLLLKLAQKIISDQEKGKKAKT